jgi:UDP-N-acetylglucosamine 2-epimerase (non-hydrolysing)
MRIAFVLGTRPEIIKCAPVIAEARSAGEEVVLIHTGQHYDWDMSGVFFEEFDLPSPRYNLAVGPGTRSEQIARTLLALEPILVAVRPDVVLVQGDTNAVVAASLAARQLLIPVGHIEAGLRSFNEWSPEEVNRRLAAQLSLLHFAPTALCRVLLREEGVPADRIIVTGNPVVDVIRQVRPHLRPETIRERFSLDPERPIVTVTVHRSTNVDDPARLRGILAALAALDRYEVVFPIHGRTRKNAAAFDLLPLLDRPHVHLTEPLDYPTFLSLMAASSLILTDSGGVQEEATELGRPLVTLREETPRWEAVLAGVNRLSGVETATILATVAAVEADPTLSGRLERARGLFGDGEAAGRIVSTIQAWYREGRLAYPAPPLGIPAAIERVEAGLRPGGE